MPGNKDLRSRLNPHQRAMLYAIAAALIVLTIYYIPDYLFLERATADHAASLLNSLGAQVESNTIGGSAYLEDIRVVRDCTGIQVMAVFVGLLIPLPNAPWGKKLLAIATVVASVYVANVLRIALEFWLVFYGILPWSLAHYPLSLLLGVVGVAILVLVTDRMLPEFGTFLLRTLRIKGGQNQGVP